MTDNINIDEFKRFAVIAYYSTGGDFYAWAVLLAIANKHGFSFPREFEDFDDYIDRIKDKEEEDV